MKAIDLDEAVRVLREYANLERLIAFCKHDGSMAIVYIGSMRLEVPVSRALLSGRLELLKRRLEGLGVELSPEEED